MGKSKKDSVRGTVKKLKFVGDLRATSIGLEQMLEVL